MKKSYGIFAGSAFAMLAAAYGASPVQASPICKNGPIHIGAISTITGLSDFSDAPNATKATFDQFNEAGGINGCKIDYTIADDKGDPQVASQAARDLIDNQNVVALSGGASHLDCSVNAGIYNKNGVLSVPAVGIDPVCFNAPSISPVNVGPYTLSTVMLDYASNTLKAKNLCAFFIIIGGTKEAYADAVSAWERARGKKMALVDMTLPPQGDLTPYLIRARDAGCDAVLTNHVEPGAVQWVKTADTQKISGISWLFLAASYTEGVATSLANSKQPVYVGTEWEPYTEDGEANAAWAKTMEKAGLKKTAFSQGGYLAAKVMIDTISGIDGEVTRSSVTSALKQGQKLNYPMAGSSYVFGDAKAHSPMKATKVMQLVEGKWTVKTSDWYALPQAE